MQGRLIINGVLMKLFSQEQIHDLACSLGNAGAGAEYGCCTGLVQEVIVLGGDDTAGDDHDVLASELLELCDDLRHERLVTGSQRADAEHVDVVLHSLTGALGGRLEEGTHVDVETAVGIAGGDDLGATVMAVLTHLGNHDTRTTALLLGKLFGEGAGTLVLGVLLGL